MKLSEQFIANLLTRIDLVDLISKKISLRRVGANFIGLCPFHQEKTPSFTVNPIKQFFYCFGCKKSGDAISFVMEIDKKSFVDAVENLADQHGLAIEQDLQQVTYNPLIENIYKILEIAADFYHQELFKNHHIARSALNYLKNRGISIETIKHYKLGVVGAGWTNIFDFFAKRSSDINLLQQAGLIIEKNGKFYDRFRARIMFPIHNKFGKTIGFGARALSTEEHPKYLNSPESVVFKKNQELYGLDEVKIQLKHLNNLIVVEGYLDVLTLVQAGINNVVATLGTAFNDNHLKIMLNITSEIIFCFDGDQAGYKATVRAMELCINMISQGIIKSKHVVKFVLLPNNYDPDLLVREKGVKDFVQLLTQARGLSDFFFEYLNKKYPEKNIENLNQLAQEAKVQITKFSDSLLKNLWYQKLADFLGVDKVVLDHNDINNNKKNNFVKNIKYNNKIQCSYPLSNASRVLAMLIVEPKLLKFCDALISDRFTNLKLSLELDLLIKVIKLMQEQQQLLYNSKDIINYLVSHLETAYTQKLLSLDVNKIVQLIPNISSEGIEQEFLGAVKRINKELIEKLVEELLVVARKRNLESQEKLLLQQMLRELYVKI